MSSEICKKKGLIAVTAICVAWTIGASAQAADNSVEKERMVRYYECCYGPSCYGHEGYMHDFNGCRCADDPTGHCDGDHCCCGHCRCGRCACSLMSPGSGYRSKFLDICLYRMVFPISPWYSHPRDGIMYPAYGSKSPTCTP